MNKLYWKHRLLRTPLEGVAKNAQHLLGAFRRRRHPELREIHLEPDRMERAMALLIRRDSNCIDVGCHIGSTLSLMLKLAPQGKHMAFEPVPQKAAWLRAKFPEVDVRQVALGEQPGKLTFTENLSRPGFSSFRREQRDTDQIREYEVQVERLDDLVGDRKLDFLKIDAEGAELWVLRGAINTVRRDHPPILFESGPGGAEKLGLTREQLFGFLTDELGYSIYFVKDFLENGKPLDWTTFDNAHHYPFKAFNYLATRSGASQ